MSRYDPDGTGRIIYIIYGSPNETGNPEEVSWDEMWRRVREIMRRAPTATDTKGA